MGRLRLSSFLSLLIVAGLMTGCAAATPPSATKAPAASTPAPTLGPSSAAAPAATAAPVAKPETAVVATPKAQTAKTPTPKSETVVVLTDSFGLEGFLPHNDSLVAFTILPLYETLWSNDTATGAIRPMLAETLPQWSEDMRTLRIKLRQGVQFQENWGEMTAEDVAYSIQLAAKPNSLNSSKSAFQAVKVEIVGPYELALHLDKPDWTWVRNAMVANEALPIVSKKHIEKVGEAEAARHPVGTGPFKLIDHRVGDSLTFEAVGNWRMMPDYKTLVVKLIADPATMIAMLRTGQADLAPIPFDFVPEAQKAGLSIKRVNDVSVVGVGLGGQYLPTEQAYDRNVPWVLADRPEQALKVRQALNLAVDRQEIVKSVLYGMGKPYPVALPPAGPPFIDASLQPYPYDAARAKQLLSDAGYPQGFTVTMTQYPYSGLPLKDVSEAVAIYWEKIGIKVNRQVVDLATQRTRQLGRKNSGIAYAVSATLDPLMEPVVKAPAYYMGSSTGLMFMFAYPDLDAMAKSMLAETNADKRLALQSQWVKKIYDGYYAVPIASTDLTFGIGKKIADWQTLRSIYLFNLEYIKVK